MYEHRKQKLISHRAFVQRLARHGVWAMLLVAGSMVVGAAGFHLFCRQPWLDAVLNAAMFLGGLGPVGDLGAAGGKIFATLYALYTGLLFLVVTGLMLAPVFHRMLHRFHLDADGNDAGRPGRKSGR